MAADAELERLRGLIDLMVTRHVSHMTCGDGTSLVLSPSAFLRDGGHTLGGGDENPTRTEKRRHYVNLLNRPVDDAELDRLP